ncbi:MAG: hypothetical protein JXB26_07435 [Candidatus Aminicenantes bacterium]|nr:hypothetical protein [Candidatus Aminicenantes bacterium]
MQEEKLVLAVKGLKKQQNNWKITRWVILILGVLLIFFGIYGLYSTNRFVRNVKILGSDADHIHQSLVLSESIARRVCIYHINILAGLILAGYAIGRWSGNPVIRLLISLWESSHGELEKNLPPHP